MAGASDPRESAASPFMANIRSFTEPSYSRSHCDQNPPIGGYPANSCCKVEYDSDGSGLSVSRFPCPDGCCGEKENQHCCQTESQKALIIGMSIFGSLLFIALVIFLVFIFRRMCRGVKEYSSHKKLLREVYSAQTLDELFVPAQRLVCAPGTIVHPVTNVSGSSYAREAEAYIVPDFNQPQLNPVPAINQPVNEDFDEENWDTWDGFPSSDNVGTSGNESASRERDSPYLYDNYSQPPPGYEEVVTKVTR